MMKALIVYGVIILVVGAIGALAPAFIIKFGRRWMFEGELKPSEFAVTLTRTISVVCIAVGLAMTLAGIFWNMFF